MTNAVRLATRYARRPLLLEPAASRVLLQHIALSDPRGLESEGRFAAALRKIGIGRARPVAMDQDDEASAYAEPDRPTAYCPLWAQQAYGDPQDEGFAWTLFEGAALMEVDGAISAKGEYYCGIFYHGYDTILAGMQEALADSRVGGLFLRMNSPGGVVDQGLPTLAAFMRAARAQAGGKPIHVYADLACSAGYWISAQADRIAAGSVGLIGSIGAVIVHEDWSEALKKAGVAITPIQFGSQKTAGAWWDQLSPDAQADLQAEIDQCGRNFVADVHAGRSLLSAQAVLDTQARVFMAQHDDPARSGLALGLVDAIETEQQAFQALLDRISPAAIASPPIAPSQAAADASRGGATSSQEITMNFGLNRKGPKTAQTAASAPAGASTPKKEPAAAMEQCPSCEGSGKNPDGSDCGTCEGTGEVEDDGAEATAGGGEGGGDDAKAISASEEAKQHPGMALTAIQTGMTFAQFKAAVATAGAQPRGSRLDAQMDGSRRLGADRPPKQSAKIDARGYYAKRAAAMGKGARRAPPPN